MTSQQIQNIIIVGGGTAGWITAAKLAKKLTTSDEHSIKVTVVESPDIPTIGVGEGTWPTMRKTLLDLGIDEAKFMAYCQATFKQGTRFVNWKHEADNGVNNHYYHTFSSIFDPADFNLAPYWLAGHAGESKTFAEAVSAQGATCDLGLAPKRITDLPYDGTLSYAYHLDAGKFADFLTEYATNELSVDLVKANVKSINQHENGDIKSLELDTGTFIEGDFFVDCTGFRSMLLGQTLGTKFKSVSDTLLTDTAVAIQVPYDSEETPIPCQTNSVAQDAGWIWDISLFNRRGTGHVFSSNHMSVEQAEQTLRNYIGEGHESLEARVLKINVGYREDFWRNNCVAIGLSAAFVEPLEASAIFLIEAGGNMLADMFPRTKSAMKYAAKQYNESFHYRWQKTIEFIKLHYFLSRRTSAFWQDNRQLSTVPEALQEKVEFWQHQAVSKYEFSNSFEPFPHESYQYVLYGMDYKELDKSSFKELPDVMKAKQYFDKVAKATDYINQGLPKHRDLLRNVYQYGFQTI